MREWAGRLGIGLEKNKKKMKDEIESIKVKKEEDEKKTKIFDQKLYKELIEHLQKRKLKEELINRKNFINGRERIAGKEIKKSAPISSIFEAEKNINVDNIRKKNFRREIENKKVKKEKIEKKEEAARKIQKQSDIKKKS